MIEHGAHLADATLARLADEPGGELASESLGVHLLECRRCSGLLTGHRRARALLLRVDPTLDPPRLPTPGGAWGRLTWLGLLADGLVAGAVVLLLIGAATRLPASSVVPPSSSGPAVMPTASSATSLWKRLSSADASGAEWSPDGRWLLVWEGPPTGSSPDRQVSVEDAAGNVVRSFGGVDPTSVTPRSLAAWIDTRSFLFARGGTIYLASVDSEGIVQLPLRGIPQGAVSNGDGVVAAATGPGLDASTTYVTWSKENGLSDVRPGAPIAWTPDGKRLAVWHWLSGSGPGTSGYIDVIDWPGGRSIAALHEDLGLPFARFDPSGRFLYDAAWVLDLSTASHLRIPLEGLVGTPSWNSSSQLVFPSEADGTVAIVDATGSKVASLPKLGDSVAASADGSTLAFWFEQQPGPISLVTRSGTQRIDLPGPLTKPDPELSPNGSRLVVTVLNQNQSEVLLVAP